MEFRLLGPLEVRDGGAPAPLPPGRPRALLALLLLNANRAVARERIVDELWGDAAPESAQKMVQIHVSRLRKALPEPRLQTRAPGYLLEVRDGELDLDRFQRLAGEGWRALEEGDAARAAAALAAAMDLWRGPALDEFSEPFARREAPRLEELGLSAVESHVEARLALGRHADVVGELEALTRRHPLRERLRGQHMLALYRSGRHGDALGSYRTFRRTLDDELGLEPSPALKELERGMLRQDPALDLQPEPVAAHRDRVRYARSGDLRIAYEIVGDGRPDLVLVNGWVCTFAPAWENPRIAGFYRRLASLGRLILFDKRGTGLSDRVSPERLPDLETRMDDVRAVMDAAGSERAVVVGVSEGGPMSALFAATYPERTAALVLLGAFARMKPAPDYPIGVAEEEYARRLAALDADDWARATAEEWLGRAAPDLVGDEDAMRWYVSYLVRGASPAASRALRVMNREVDVRPALPAIDVPTLALCRSGEYMAAATRDMAERIPTARLVELPGRDHLPWEGDSAAVLAEIERFLEPLLGRRARPGFSH